MRVVFIDTATAAADRTCDFCGETIAARCQYSRVAAFDGENGGFSRVHLHCEQMPARAAAYTSAPDGGAESEDCGVVKFFAGLGVEPALFRGHSAGAAVQPLQSASEPRRPRTAAELVEAFGGDRAMAAAIRRDVRVIHSWLRSHHAGDDSLARVRFEAQKIGIDMTAWEIRRLFDDARRFGEASQCGL